MADIERWYACDNCGRVGTMREFQDECKPGWTHGTLLPLDMESPALSNLRGAVDALGEIEDDLRAWRRTSEPGCIDHALQTARAALAAAGGQ